MIVGLSGYARSGKDEVAKILVNEYQFKRIAFADAIRDCVYVLNPYIESDLRVAELVDGYGWEVAKSKEEVRRLLQVFGTEVGRRLLGDNVWIDKVFKQLYDLKDYVIPDVRFANEMKAIRHADGEVWRVNREGVVAVNSHVSENSLDEFIFDHLIDNNGTLDDLKNRVVTLMER